MQWSPPAIAAAHLFATEGGRGDITTAESCDTAAAMMKKVNVQALPVLSSENGLEACLRAEPLLAAGAKAATMSTLVAKLRKWRAHHQPQKG